MTRFYVGKREGKGYVFKSDIVPTEATHGQRYRAVIGPFRTKRAAILCAVTGGYNPHIQHVNDAGRIAKRPAQKGA